MKWKKRLFITLIVLGLCVIVVVFFLRNSGLSKREINRLMSAAGSLTAISVSQLLGLYEEEGNPRLRRRNEIERNDERNVAIRNRAKALSGDVLQWSLILAAWAALIFGAPLWVPLAAVMVFIVKSLLEFFLMERYQKEM